MGNFLGIGGIFGLAVGACVLVAMMCLCCIIAARRMPNKNFVSNHNLRILRSLLQKQNNVTNTFKFRGVLIRHKIDLNIEINLS